ncbi:MAG: class I SAM-dependent methyltransferase [Ktedonobacteraceae bacterium]|nr:class I SAM-dependent methyltransferase [Ktedonobacteraceae bacterium]
MMAGQQEIWSSGSAYESYVGRWSRLVAREFLAWLAVAPDLCWLDVGCGTGALSQTILEHMAPRLVVGVDFSEGYITFAREHIRDGRAAFLQGDARALPVMPASYDVVVSGLALNFIPQPEQAVAEMARAARTGGIVAAYVWDYAGRMQFMRTFWNAATALDPAALQLDEGRRFPLCQPEPLRQLFQDAGLHKVLVRSIDVATIFRNFDDYWSPFLGGQGSAPGYVMSLSDEQRALLREQLRTMLPTRADGSIFLTARAWAVCGMRNNHL